jgi:hypothetical protein
MLEYYGATLFCVLRPARYIDETETVEFGEMHVFAGPQFVITANGKHPERRNARKPMMCERVEQSHCPEKQARRRSTPRRLPRDDEREREPRLLSLGGWLGSGR